MLYLGFRYTNLVIIERMFLIYCWGRDSPNPVKKCSWQRARLTVLEERDNTSTEKKMWKCWISREKSQQTFPHNLKRRYRAYLDATSSTVLLFLSLTRLSNIEFWFCSTGTLVWKVNEYSAKFEEARGKDGMELISSPFYTSQFGYKLQASVFLNGNGAGEGTHISVYIKILPGEYDALLRWPFAHTVSFTLFDQGEKVSF